MLLFIYPILFLFVDFILFNIFQFWVSYFLLAYFIGVLLEARSDYKFTICLFYFPLFLLLLQDCFINGRFGLSLIYIIPLIFLTLKIKNFFEYGVYLIYGSSFAFLLFLQEFLVKKVFLSQYISVYSTINIIWINLIVAYIIFLGIRGNRSLFNFK